MKESDGQARLRLSSQDRLAFVTIIVVAVVLRAIGLTVGQRIDERLTYQHFVSQSWTTAVSDYSMVNNHIFHTVLAKLSVGVFGPWLWALRLPAFIAGVLVVPATFFAIRPLYGPRAALLAAGLVATCSEMVEYATNARGYSMMTLAFLLLIMLAERMRHSATARDWLLYAVVSALALWTIPAALYPVGGVSVWLALSFVEQRAFRDLRAFVVTMVCAGLLTLALYAPVLVRGGFAPLVSNDVVSPSPWPVFLRDMRRSVGDTLWFWDRGMPAVFAIILAACAVVAVIFHKRLSQDRIGLPYVVAAWCVVLLAVNHRAPQVRVWQWLAPLGAGLASAGVVYLIDRSPRVTAFTARRFPAWVAAFSVICAVSLIGVGLF